MFHEVIFPCFETPKMVIGDGGSDFIDKTFWNFLKYLGSRHNIATPYHPQTSGQAEMSNKQIKNILQKWLMRWGKAGRTSYLMHFGHTGQLTKPPSACHHTNSFIEKVVTYQSS
jgi:hypothetical protein